jgi:prevent-host-death family protein
MISTHEAKTHLSKYLAAAERGEEFLIARGKKPMARLVPVGPIEKPSRPKVGETLGPKAVIPDSVFAPMTDEELKVWYE